MSVISGVARYPIKASQDNLEVITVHIVCPADCNATAITDFRGRGVAAVYGNLSTAPAIAEGEIMIELDRKYGSNSTTLDALEGISIASNMAGVVLGPVTSTIGTDKRVKFKFLDVTNLANGKDPDAAVINVTLFIKSSKGTT